MTSEGSAPRTIWLEHPRALSAHERALLDRLLAHPAATAELREQAERAVVDDARTELPDAATLRLV